MVQIWTVYVRKQHMVKVKIKGSGVIVLVFETCVYPLLVLLPFEMLSFLSLNFFIYKIRIVTVFVS